MRKLPHWEGQLLSERWGRSVIYNFGPTPALQSDTICVLYNREERLCVNDYHDALLNWIEWFWTWGRHSRRFLSCSFGLNLTHLIEFHIMSSGIRDTQRSENPMTCLNWKVYSLSSTSVSQRGGNYYSFSSWLFYSFITFSNLYICQTRNEDSFIVKWVHLLLDSCLFCVWSIIFSRYIKDLLKWENSHDCSCHGTIFPFLSSFLPFFFFPPLLFSQISKTYMPRGLGVSPSLTARELPIYVSTMPYPLPTPSFYT